MFTNLSGHVDAVQALHDVTYAQKKVTARTDLQERASEAVVNALQEVKNIAWRTCFALFIFCDMMN